MKIWRMYQFVGNQIRVAPMGEVIGLDYGAVLDTIKLYATNGDARKIFEGVLTCHRIVQEFNKANK